VEDPCSNGIAKDVLPGDHISGPESLEEAKETSKSSDHPLLAESPHAAYWGFVPAAKEAPKKEEKPVEEEDDDMGLGLFD